MRSSWNIVIDEAIDPFRMITYQREDSAFDWTSIVRGNLERIEIDSYTRVHFSQSKIDDTFIMASPLVRDILDTNWITDITSETYRALASDTQRVELFQALRGDIICGWRSVHIAAAAFDHTFMAAWMRYHGIEWQVIRPFEHKELPARIHYVEQLRWSKTKAGSGKYDAALNEYYQYVESGSSEFLRLKNLSVKNRLAGEITLSHNPHGLNEYKHITAISLESALNPTQSWRLWLQNTMKMTPKQVTVAFSSYLFYQCVMRTALRDKDNSQVVHIYGLDEPSIVGLLQFFDPRDSVHIDVGIESRVIMSAAERKRKQRSKDKH
jgi:hypothetical protein